jgi:hypothetical protein
VSWVFWHYLETRQQKHGMDNVITDNKEVSLANIEDQNDVHHWFDT